jgi:hypothetical protein
MAAHLEAEGLLERCATERDVMVKLVASLLVTRFADCAKCPELGSRSREIALSLLAENN